MEKSGVKTSEFWLTSIAMLLGMILESVAIPLIEKAVAADGANMWLPVVLILAGAAVQICALFGYTKSRAVLKIANVQAAASLSSQTAGLQVGPGTVVQTAEAVKAVPTTPLVGS